MIFYKSVCKRHRWESPGLYKTRANAVRSARAHRNNVSGFHQIVILEVYIPTNAMQIKSENSL